MKRQKISPKSFLRLLTYGKPGSGKTTFYGSAGIDPRTAPVLWLDAGGNPISLAQLGRIYGAAPDIDLLKIDAVSDLADVYNWLIAGQPSGPFATAFGLRSGYRCLVLDGITHTQRLSFDAVQGTGDLPPGAMIPRAEWPHYGTVLRQMMKIASGFYTLPMHVLITALEHADKRRTDPNDAKTEYTVYEPALAGQAVDEFPGWAFTSGRLAHASAFDPSVFRQLPGGRTARNIWQIERDRYTDAKDQHGFGAGYIADPTIGDLIDRMVAAEAAALAPGVNDTTPAGKIG